MVTALDREREIVVLVYFPELASGDGQPLPFLHSRGRLINASLSLIIFKWPGKLLYVNSIERLKVVRVRLAVCSSAL